MLVFVSIVALIAQLSYYNIEIPPSPYWRCTVTTTILSMATGCSTWFILSMTFERFYSIIRPHKAASFNTMKRARIIIVCIIVIMTLYSLPHLFMTNAVGSVCVPYSIGMDYLVGKVYYWMDQFIGFGFPFVALLIMNVFIIHTLCKRSSLLKIISEDEGQGKNQDHSSKMKSSEKQIIIMLLLVTFGFLILMSPSYSMTLYTLFVDVSSSPELYAGFFLFLSIGQKTYFTNFGINFYLYVISGHKFRSDLLRLFESACPYFCKKGKHSRGIPVSKSSSENTVVTSAEM